MLANEEAAHLIAQTLNQLGLAAPTPPSEGVSVTLKDGTVLRVEAVDDGRRVVAWTELLRWPSPDEEAKMFEQLLALHAFGIATEGASFAANREAGTVIAFKSFPAARLSPQWLAEELEGLVRLVAKFQDLRNAGEQAAAAAGSHSFA